MKKFFISTSFLIFILTPMTLVLSQTVTGHMSGITFVCNNGTTDVPCEGFSLLIQAVQGVVSVVVVMALAFSVIVIAKAGFIYLTSGGEPGKRKEANDMFVKVAWGVFWILAAWVVINMIMTALPISKDVPIFLNNS